MWIIEHFDPNNGLQHLASELRKQNEKLLFIDCTKGEEYKKCSENKIIFFGSQELGEKLKSEGKIGLFLGHNKFLHIQNQNFLNHLGLVIKFSEVKEKGFVHFPNGFFIRPNSWVKHFSGQVLTPENFDKQWERVSFYIENPDIEVIIAPLSEISQEFRVLYIKNKIVTASTYNPKTKEQEETSINSLKDLIESIKDLIPDESCTIDIAKTSSGELKVIEFNPISTSAIYRCDPKKIIEAFKN